ncbi:MAG: hypothetical protein Kow0029_32210 [Candidatus Rifleibacteriota bacterium]
MSDQEIFNTRIDQLQPTQAYISQSRLNNVSRHMKFLAQPFPVRLINSKFCLLEGHERCYLLSSIGESTVNVYIEKEKGPSDQALRELVDYVCKQGILSIGDLEDRILPPHDFKHLWLEVKKEIIERNQE